MIITGLHEQDSIKQELVIRIDTEKLISDSTFRKLDQVPAFRKTSDSGSIKKKISTDLHEKNLKDTTITVPPQTVNKTFGYCTPEGFTGYEMPLSENQLPFRNMDTDTSQIRYKNKIIIKSLKEGLEFPQDKLHNDWITLLILFSTILWLVARINTKSIFSDMNRFFLMRGINESKAYETGSLFYWQSTIINFASFLIIGLFIYCVAAFYDFIPEVVPPFVFFLLSLGIVISAITSRHIICTVAGNLSGEYNMFNEYIMTVYHSYRFSAIAEIILLVMILYTTFISPIVFLIAGIIVFCIFYLYRISRLSIIFIKRNISILYLILYLCALEILPVLILIKYFTGRV